MRNNVYKFIIKRLADIIIKMNNIKQSVKNYQDEETIKSMYKKSFKKDANNITISKLSGGMKNAVYLVSDDSEKVVLKIAPQDESKMIYADRDIIWWETEMLKKMENIKFPSPKLLYYDDSLEVCYAPYFFMSFLDGKNYSEIKDELSDKEKSKIEYKLGCLSKKICNIKGDFELISFKQIKKGAFSLSFNYKNELKEIKSAGNGPVNACLNALGELGFNNKLIDYKQYSLDGLEKGSGATAMTAIIMQDNNGEEIIGRAIDSSTAIANVKAIFNALNQMN